jgi:energy-coupling factor transporter ATP-binding protein EcfA2
MESKIIQNILVEEEYDDEGKLLENFDIRVNREKLNVKTVLLLGLTGSGKSRFINLLMGKNDPSSMSSRPVTTAVRCYGGVRINNMSLNVIDTIGLGDPSQDVDVITAQIKRTLFLNCPNISKVLIFIKMDRLRAKISEDLNQVLSDFVDCGMTRDHVHLIITFKDWFNNETCEIFYRSVQSSRLHDIIKSCPYSFISLINPKEVQPHFIKDCKILLQQGFDEVLNVIESHDKGIFSIKPRFIDEQLEATKFVMRVKKWLLSCFCCKSL